MLHAQEVNTLLERARAIAAEKFSKDTSGRNADKVCVVALQIDARDQHYALFSGAPGFTELTNIVRNGGDKTQAANTITSKIKTFLASEDGGKFSETQITNTGYDAHGRGAMNCAEPKMYYLLKHHEQKTLRNWVIIPFNLNGDKAVVYNPPCKNCRRWVYKHFHPLSGLIAQSEKGPAAFEA
jgi:hypothetical protein